MEYVSWVYLLYNMKITILIMSKSSVKAIFIAMLVHWRVYGGVLNQAFYGDNGDTMDKGMWIGDFSNKYGDDND